MPFVTPTYLEKKNYLEISAMKGQVIKNKVYPKIYR